MDVLFCWSQLGDADDLKSRFSEATNTDTRFLKALQALRGWANSSDRGVYHPLYAQYVTYVADPVEVRKRLEQLSIRPGFGARSEKAKELLAAWEPFPGSASSGQSQGDLDETAEN